MKPKSFTALAALAVAAVLAAGDQAQAAYNYSTAISIDSAPGATITPSATGVAVTFGGTTVTFTNIPQRATNFAVPSTNTINIGNIDVNTTTPLTSSDSFSISYTDLFTLSNIPPPGFAETQSFPVRGVLTLNSVNVGSGTVSNMYLAPSSGTVEVGGVTFIGAADNFGNPTINGEPGNLGGTLTAVPEPASVALLGLGAVGAVGLLRYRRRAA